MRVGQWSPDASEHRRLTAAPTLESSAAALVLAACLLVFPGCLYPGIAVGVVVGSGALGGGGGGTAAPAPPPPPSVEIASSLTRTSLVDASGAPSATVIAITYRTVDATSAPLQLEVLWRRSAEPESAFRPATEAAGAGSDGTTGLISGPDPGVLHRFVWAAGTDLASQSLVEDDVVIRLTLLRGAVASAARDGALRAGNRAPVVSIDAATAPLTRTVFTTYHVSDSSSDPTMVSLAGQVLDGNGAPIGPLVPILDLFSGSTSTAIAPGVSPTRGGLVWDSVDASPLVPGQFGVSNVAVQLSLTARDVFGLTGVTTTMITLLNDNPPQVALLSAGTPPKPFRGRIPFTFTASDLDALLDPRDDGVASFRVEFATSPAQPFQRATGLVLGESVNSFSSSRFLEPIGATLGASPHYTFLWDSEADVGQVPGSFQAGIQITPVNALTGSFTRSVLTLSNTVPFALAASPVNPAIPLPAAVLSGDWDGDGTADVAVADAGANAVRIYLGLGAGAFNLVQTIPVAGGPQAIAAADLTGDGLLDLVVGSGSGAISVLAGRGNGLFDPVPTGVTLSGVRAIAIADWTGDGIPDLAVAQASAVTILKGAPGGRFSPTATIPGLGTDLRSLVALDWNGDGLQDLAVADFRSGTISIIFGQGDGTFRANPVTLRTAGNPTALAALDANGDGVPDLGATVAGSNVVALFLGAGAGAFQAPATTAVPQNPSALVAGDVTDDRIDDISVASLDGSTLSVLAGRGDGTFRPIASPPPGGSSPLSIAAGEFMADGGSSLTAGDTSGRVNVVTPGGGLALDAMQPLPAAPGPRAMLATDLNGDGRPDLVVACATADQVEVLLAQPGGAFSQLPTFTTAPQSIATADFNGDGIPDVAVASGVARTVVILLGAGNGSFSRAGSAAIGTNPVALAALDLNGDGHPDVAVLDGTAGTVRVFLGDGNGAIAAAAQGAIAAGTSPTALAILDFDGDGIPDLAVATTAPPSCVSLLRGRGDGGFDPAPVVHVGVSGEVGQALAVADLTGDGIPDLVLASRAPGSPSSTATILRGRGDGGFDAIATFRLGNGTRALALADLNGDGIPEIIAANALDGTVTVNRIESGGPRAPARGERGLSERRFLAASAGTIPVGQPQDVTTLDATFDGVPDIACLDASPARSIVNVVSVTHHRGSRALALPSGGAAPGVDAGDQRVVTSPALDPSLGEPGLVSAPTAGTRLAPASAASTVSPDTVSFAATPITLPLFSELTGRELTAGAIHVLRYERDVQGARSLPFRRPLAGRIVEVASTVSPSARPPFVAAATVDPVAGTITFPTARFGTFQSFLEVPTGAAAIFRETFDDARSLDGALAPLPRGWSAGYTWQVGPPPPASAGGPDAAASFPNVLGTCLRGAAYRTGAADSVTSTMIPIGTPDPLGAGLRVRLRFREWYRFGSGDQGTLGVIVNGALAAVATRTGSSPGNGFVDAGPFDLTPLVGSGPGFRITLRLASSPGGSPLRGWYVDDVTVSIEPP